MVVCAARFALLVRTAGPRRWFALLVRVAGPRRWPALLVRAAGSRCWFALLVCAARFALLVRVACPRRWPALLACATGSAAIEFELNILFLLIIICSPRTYGYSKRIAGGMRMIGGLIFGLIILFLLIGIVAAVLTVALQKDSIQYDQEHQWGGRHDDTNRP